MLQSKMRGIPCCLQWRAKKKKNAVDKRVHEIKTETEDEEAEGAVVRHDPIRRRLWATKMARVKDGKLEAARSSKSVAARDPSIGRAIGCA
jgi:hypothetical protein